MSDELSVYAFKRKILCEQHYESAILPFILKVTKTDFGVALGLPSTFWDGNYNKSGERKMIRLRDVINHGAWKKSLVRPAVHSLPPGFTLIHFSLVPVATDFTRFFLNYYSPRYRTLPSESKSILFNGARACAIWEGVNEKIRLEEMGIQAFGCPWVYERIKKGRELFDLYPKKLIEINRAAKAYRNSKGRFGYSAEVAYDRKCEAYTFLNEQLEDLAHLPPPMDLPPLPPGVSAFRLLEDPPPFMNEEEA